MFAAEQIDFGFSATELRRDKRLLDRKYGLYMDSPFMLLADELKSVIAIALKIINNPKDRWPLIEKYILTAICDK